MIEVEMKFPVASMDVIRQEFLELGAQPQAETDQSDEYWNDPLRDFGKLDLALRIRRSGENYQLTFKEKILDQTAKVRREIELPLADEEVAKKMRDVFAGIGFYTVATVTKRREELLLNWQGENVLICLDDVEEVGGFVELELVVQDQEKVPAAKNVLENLSQKIGLSGSTQTSYLRMLLKKRGSE